MHIYFQRGKYIVMGGGEMLRFLNIHVLQKAVYVLIARKRYFHYLSASGLEICLCLEMIARGIEIYLVYSLCLGLHLLLSLL